MSVTVFVYDCHNTAYSMTDPMSTWCRTSSPTLLPYLYVREISKEGFSGVNKSQFRCSWCWGFASPTTHPHAKCHCWGFMIFYSSFCFSGSTQWSSTYVHSSGVLWVAARVWRNLSSPLLATYLFSASLGTMLKVGPI